MSGATDANMNGWRRPQRERRLSDHAPISGSEIASMTLATKNTVPQSAAPTPSTWL